MLKKIILILLFSFSTSSYTADDGVKYIILTVRGHVDRIRDYGSSSVPYELAMTYCSNPIKLDTNLYTVEDAKLAFKYVSRKKFKRLGEVTFIAEAPSRSELRRLMLDEHAKYTKKGFPKLTVTSVYIKKANEGKLKF